MQITCWTCPPPWQDSISHLLKPNTNIKKFLGGSNNDPQFKPKMNQLKLVPIQFKLLLIPSLSIIPWVGLILHNNQCQSNCTKSIFAHSNASNSAISTPISVSIELLRIKKPPPDKTHVQSPDSKKDSGHHQRVFSYLFTRFTQGSLEPTLTISNFSTHLNRQHTKMAVTRKGRGADSAALAAITEIQ